MSSDKVPDYWSPANDDSLEVFPATETKGALTPPPRKPPTAVSAEAAEPEPRPPRPSRRWDIPTRRSDLPRNVAQAIDAALDVLDAIGDSVRATAARLARLFADIADCERWGNELGITGYAYVGQRVPANEASTILSTQLDGTEPAMTARHDASPPYVRFLSSLIRPFPDFDFAFVRPLRAKAVALLKLSEGSRALDLGCGPGGSLPYLRDAVGASGEVVGVEISREVAINAQRRIDRHRWSNVHVITAPAQSVTLDGRFDGALMFAAPDVFASTEALANILPYLQPGARVAFFGAKTSRRRMGWLLNTLLRTLVPRVSFRTTPVPDDEPWRLIAAHVDRLTIEEYFFGWMFLASGSVKGH